MTIGTLSLTGFPFTAGFFSKDAIIEAAFASDRPGAFYAFLAVTAAAALTAFYSWRLIFMTFFGKPRWQAAEAHVETAAASLHGAGTELEPTHGEDHGDHGTHTGEAHAHHIDPHESPNTMMIPLYVLALGSLFAGLAFAPTFIGEGAPEFWRGALFYGSENHILHEMHEVPGLVSFLPTIMMVGGALIAVYGYLIAPTAPAAWARTNPILYKFLLNKWYFDEIYDFIFVRPAFWLGRLFWHGGDQNIIDRLGPDGIAARVVDVTNRVVKLQSGYVYHYAFAMLVGVAALITWYLVGSFR
jgi:NADH-quinone oxidoreductase subunit L